MPSETIELQGHIMDSHTLEKVLDQIMAIGADYEIEQIRLGHTRHDESYARVRIESPDRKLLDDVLELVTRSGAMLARAQEATLERAPRDGIFPDDFYASTNLPTEVLLGGRWIGVANAEMDCAIVVNPKKRTARCLRMHRVKKNEWVVTGHAGVRVEPLERVRGLRGFEFMASAVSSEKPKQLVIREIVRQMREVRRAKKRILFVGGPAIIHTGAGQHLASLIKHGYVDVLFAGNALAAHDIESALFGTSLGVSLKSGSPVEHGHEHHLRTINRIRSAGSIKAAVKKGILKSGVMHTCVVRGVKFVLSGSIRDDGPLPDVITDMPAAQDAMRAELPGVGLALMVGTTLLSIATGNMLPAAVRTICVDINPAVVTKLSDRGTQQAIGLVTDAELFLRSLTRELGINR
jgi:lysine-ketoglutarate reductase/saccharopine dehydrogenase-like protein (TIGR00300 family)